MNYFNLENGINVLSLFDGMSCGQIALSKLGFKVNNYFASEIDVHAINVTKHNFPSTQHLGSVINVIGENLPKIDLLIGGSPCQSFSFAGKRKGMVTKDNIEILSLDQYLKMKEENFEFEGQSYLFWEYVRLLREVKPTYFLLENVKMIKKWEDVITKELGIPPIKINSNLVSAQNRTRLYWTNIPGVNQPNDKQIYLKDIVHEANEPHYMALNGKHAEWFAKNAEYQLEKKYSSLNSDKAISLIARQYANWNGNYLFESLNEYIVPFDETFKLLEKEVKSGKVGYFRKDSQANRVYYINEKAITLCGCAGGGAAKMGQYLFGSIIKDSNNDNKRFYTLTDNSNNEGLLVEGYIRKLTPIECERLQNVPDNYSSIVSNMQRYKMLGNGWTVDVISHILSFMDIKNKPLSNELF